ncbi:MAG: hypothetical protein ACR2KG_10400 [Nocardioidaceae bacterium]
MSYHTIARTLVTGWAGDTPTSGFRIEIATEAFGETFDAPRWVVSDGQSSETFTLFRADEALRTYAEYIETFLDDATDAAAWSAEIARARTDAAAWSAGIKARIEASAR